MTTTNYETQLQRNYEQAVSDYRVLISEHQHCAAHLQFLANRAEELSSLLAGMTTERDGLREVLREVGIRLHGLQLHLTAGADGGDIASDIRGIRDEILHTLNHAEQGEGSDADISTN